MRNRKKYFFFSVLLLLLSIISGELFARYYFGLGHPPLFVKHPTIEYLHKKNQDLYRFHNHIIVNQYGMRTIPFERQKTKGEVRLMVFGDSVINGGGLTDHSDLATSLIQENIIKAGHQKAIVGNISAGSWGPGNWLAYTKEYGFFDADIVVLVLSSHDYADSPDFHPLNKYTHPTKSPVSALYEGLDKYLPRYLPQFGINQHTTETDHPSDVINEASAQQALEDLNSFLKLAKRNSKAVLVFQHVEKLEIEKDTKNIGFQHIREACNQLNIRPISLEPYFRKSIQHGNNPFRDNIHPNKAGQRLIAEAIIANLPPNLRQATPLSLNH